VVKRLTTYTPGKTVWRVHPAVNGRLVGEERDTEQRRVSFFALDFASAKPLWQGLTLEQQWWTGIDRVEGDLLFVHGFVSPDLPMKRGITVVDIPTGKMLWAEPLWTLDVVRGDFLHVRTDKRDGEPILNVEARTGDVIPGAESPANDEGGAWWNSVSYPDPITVKECAAHPFGSLLIKEWGGDAIIGGVEALETPALYIAAAAVQRRRLGTEMLVHALCVVDKKRRKIVHDATLTREAKGAVMESFFVQDGTLVYVQDRRDLCFYRL
jgi:hypothetical protein